MSQKQDNTGMFSDFPGSDKDQWIQQAVDDLKGADFNKKLVWNPVEGFEIDPFYTRNETGELSYLKMFYNPPEPKDAQTPQPRTWDYIETIPVLNTGQANHEATEALQMGADGLAFLLQDRKVPDFRELLAGIRTEDTVIRIIPASGNASELVQNLLTVTGPESLHGGVDYDPVRNLARTGTLDDRELAVIGEIIKITKDIPDFRVLTIHGDHFQNAGGDMTQEIACTLSVVVEYLDRLTEAGHNISQILSNLEIVFATGTSYFMEIGKLRAFRVLLHHVLSAYTGNRPEPEFVPFHCNTALWTETLYDPYVNILRNTTEAMSSVLGGCNSLSITPFDSLFRSPSDFSRRIARNISNLLKEEAYFGKVMDPAAGSYYIDKLTDKLVENSLIIFKDIESRGGFVNSFSPGVIPEWIRSSREQKHKLIALRRDVFIGSNQYPEPEEKTIPHEFFRNAGDPERQEYVLPESRGTIPFEQIRMNTDRYVLRTGKEKRPVVFLSLIGEDKIMRKARATFAAGFFGCAGFHIRESSPSDSIAGAVEKAVESKAEIVVICGADEDYRNAGVEYAVSLRARSSSILVIAGNPEAEKQSLHHAGITDFINLRSDIVDSLKKFQVMLKIIEN